MGHKQTLDRALIDAVRIALRKIKPVNAEGPVTDWLRTLVKQFKDPSVALAWLCAYDPDSRIKEDALLMLFTAINEPGVPEKVQDQFKAHVPPVLMDALKDSALPDERKALLAPLLLGYGINMPTDELSQYFKDFDTAAQKMVQEATEKIPDTIESVEQELEMCGLIGDAAENITAEQVNECFEIGTKVAENNPALGATVLCVGAAIAAEHDLEIDDCSEALANAAATRTDRAAWLLTELGRMPAMGALGERANELALEMAQTGISPRAPLPGEFSHALLSSVDGNGSRSLVLFFRTNEGEMDSISFLINDLIGIKDLWAVFGDAAEVESILRQDKNQITFANCSLSLSCELVGSALAIHEELNRRAPGRLLLYRHFLGPEKLQLARRTPNLGVYMLETVSLRPEMLAESDDLSTHNVYGSLWCASDAAYEFVSREISRSDSPAQRKPIKSKAKKKKLRISDEQLDGYIKAIAIKERDFLAGRIAANLEVEALAGKAKDPRNRMAAHVWLALARDQDVMPFERIPFVRALCRTSIQQIHENIKNGHHNQDEANRAGLEADQFIFDAMSSFLDEDSEQKW